MEWLIPLGRTFFAMALIGLGAEHFLLGDFITGRAPAWPEAIPGKAVWAYGTGTVFVAIGVSMLAAKNVRSAAVLAAVMIAAWALLRHLPVLASVSLLSPAWTAAGKALTLTGGALAIADRRFLVLGRWCLGLFLVITGIQHFMFTPFVASLIPAWFPGDAVFWTYVAGVALIAGGLGLTVPPTARLAALLSGLMVFSWFWIIHIPRTLTSVSDGIAVFEALAVSGIAFVLAGYGPWRSDQRFASRATASPK